jgi:hypothetical protein
MLFSTVFLFALWMSRPGSVPVGFSRRSRCCQFSAGVQGPSHKRKLPIIPFLRSFVGVAAPLIDVIASALPTNQLNEFAGPGRSVE